MSDWLLIGTAGCHLCEEAAEILREVGLDFQEAEIMDNPVWQARFALQIPVIHSEKSGDLLGWPFTAAQVQTFITASQSHYSNPTQL